MTAPVRHPGDPVSAYNAATTGAAFLLRDDRATLRVYGRDPLRIMQGIVTNDVSNAPDDRVVYAAFLTPKGRMVADVRVIRLPAGDARSGIELLLDVPRTALASLLEMFKRTIPPLFARFEDVSDSYHLAGLYGPDAPRIAHTLTGSSPAPERDAYARAEIDGHAVHLMCTLDTGTPAIEFLFEGDVDSLAAKAVDLGATRMGMTTFDVLRIEAGTPRWGNELDTNTIPLEAGLQQRAIATTKGCYTGQEVIIRILHRGHVNWNLCGFMFGDVPTPRAGESLFAGDSSKAVARITSAAYSPRYAQVIGLGYIRREATLPAQLHAENDHASVTAVPLPFSGALEAHTS
jgi:folate-binding protein YgfZ